MNARIQSESDAAHLFCQKFGNQVRYVPERDEWLIRNGALWAVDSALQIDGLIRSLLDKREDIDFRWKGSLNVVRNVKGFAKRDPTLHLPAREIDADASLVGTKTMVFSISNSQPITPKNTAYVVNRASVDPDFGRVPRRWIKFLTEICGGDMQLVAFLQRWAGYILSGSVTEHALLVIYGPGGNGKGVLVNTLTTIMGSYHREAASNTFVQGNGRSHESAMAFLAGARFVTSTETDQDGSWNEAAMKRAVAGDPVTARFLYKPHFTYRPTYKIWITTNHLPKLTSVGPAMRRRIHLLELSYVPAKPDRDLEEKLRGEHEAILAWMLEGAREWYKHGLNPPKSVRLATDEYFEEQDVMGLWLREQTRRLEDAITPTSALCESYNLFLRSRNQPEMEASYFGRELSKRGYKRDLAKPHNASQRTRCFLGIKLRTRT